MTAQVYFIHLIMKREYQTLNQHCTATLAKLNYVPGFAKNTPYPPSPASEALSCYEGILPSGRDASGNAFLLYCRAVRLHTSPIRESLRR